MMGVYLTVKPLQPGVAFLYPPENIREYRKATPGCDGLNIFLKELRNRILCIICACSLFCSIWIYVSLHFLPILLKNFCLSVFCDFLSVLF